MMFRIQLANPGALEGWRGAIARGLADAATEAGEAMTQEALRIARERTLSRNRRPRFGSGRYFNSLAVVSRKLPGRVEGVLSTNSAIGPVIEFGSRPHLIQPRTRRALFWPGGKHPVKTVRHPGTPAYRVLSEAALEAAEQAGGYFAGALDGKLSRR